MGNIKVKVKNKTVKIKVNRPKFDDVWSSYPVGMEASKVYELVGGQAYELHKSNPKAYANACALRLSRSFNYGGLIITPNASGYKVAGDDKKNYLLRVNDMINFVQANFGKPDIVIKPNGEDKTAEFKDKKGVLIFKVSGWGDATGHVTLWDGTMCGDHCYFTHESLFGFPPSQKTTDIYYWELK